MDLWSSSSSSYYTFLWMLRYLSALASRSLYRPKYLQPLLALNNEIGQELRKQLHRGFSWT